MRLVPLRQPDVKLHEKLFTGRRLPLPIQVRRQRPAMHFERLGHFPALNTALLQGRVNTRRMATRTHRRGWAFRSLCGLGLRLVDRLWVLFWRLVPILALTLEPLPGRLIRRLGPPELPTNIRGCPIQRVEV